MSMRGADLAWLLIRATTWLFGRPAAGLVLGARRDGRTGQIMLTDALEDSGPTFVEFAQIPQPLLKSAQLGVIERPGRLLPVSGNKGHGRSAIEQRDGSGDLLLADAQVIGDAQVNRLHRPD